MIYLAYDGSQNGDWISRYAIGFAAHSPEKVLTLLHVQDGSIAPAALDGKLERIARECRDQGVELFPQVLPLEKNVFKVLLRHLPAGAENFVVCGTRLRSRRAAYLSGTVSEKLLRFNRFHVLALRVGQPGLLGRPREFLLPLAGHPRGFDSAWPFFRLFLPDVDQVYLLRGMAVSPFRLHHLSPEKLQRLRAQGVRYLATVSDEILRGRGSSQFHLDTRIVICDDWAGEILVHASRLRSQMVLLGASERALPRRLIYRDPLERLLRGTPCDMGVYRGI